MIDNLAPQPQRDIEDEVRVVIDHRSRRWQLTALMYLSTILNVTRYDCPGEIAKALTAEKAAKAI